MENEIETFKQIAAHQRDLPVWEKFESHEEDHPRLKMEPPPKMNGVSTVWFTQNMEYGRFQLKNRGFPGEGDENGQQEAQQEAPPQDANAQDNTARPQSEGGQSYLSDKVDTERDQNRAENEQNAQQQQGRPFTGVQNIPPTIDMKYYAASRRGNRPTGETGGNRLTTGYAKQYMSSEHGRFWDNIQDVAPIAGYDVSPKPVASPPTQNAEVLQVE